MVLHNGQEGSRGKGREMWFVEWWQHMTSGFLVWLGSVIILAIVVSGINRAISFLVYPANAVKGRQLVKKDGTINDAN